LDFPYIGEIFATSTALCWAFAVILFRKSGFEVSPISLNFFKNTVACILFALTLLILQTPLNGDITNYEIAILVMSGIIGIAIADTLFFLSLNILGASLSAIVDCLYSPFTVLFAFLLLGERISAWDYVGAGFIVSAVFMTSGSPQSSSAEKSNLIKGVLIGAVAMSLMAFGIILAKPIIDKTPVLWSSSIRLFAATVAMAFMTLILPSKRKAWKVFKPGPHWKISVPASIIGAYLSMILWIAGMKYTKASIAAILNQLSTIFIVILAFMFLKESLTPKKIMATVLALIGALLVVLA